MKHLHAFIALMVGCLFAGCHSNIDLENIDTTAEVEMGLALPIGSLHATLGDFIGNGMIDGLYIDSLDNQGVFTWKAAFDISRNYHQIDLAKYISSARLNLNVYDYLPAYIMIGTNKRIVGTGDPVTLDFPLTIKLKGINHVDSLSNERLDSALIEMASFASTINRENGLPLEWEWIDQVTLDLGERVHRAQGSTVTVYDKNHPAVNDYGKKVATNVDRFSINLMKNTHPTSLAGYVNNNVVDEVSFTVHFTFTVPAGDTIDVPEEAGFDYKLDVQFMNYSAIWGMFSPSSDMSAESLIDLADAWNALEFLTHAKLPFADPRVKVNIITQVAGAMQIKDAYIFAKQQDGERVYAEFDDDRKQKITRDLENWLNPATSAIGDSTTNMYINFDNSSKGGRIDRLFNGIPTELGYCFNVGFNESYSPQIRITPNTSVHVHAATTLPMIFNQGTHIDFTDTIKDVNLSKFSIDSLLAEVSFVDTMKTTDVTVYIAAKNTIPLDIKGTLRCYDAAGNMLMDPEDNTKPLLLFPQDTIKFLAPEYEYTLGNWNMVNEGQTAITAKLSKAIMDMLPQIDHIMYFGLIDDESLADVFDRGYFNVKLTADSGITLKIALTAKADAILNFNELFK